MRSPAVNFRAFCRGPIKHSDLVAQSQVLEFEGSARAEDSTHSSEECREKNEHRRRVYESSINGSRSDISRFSRATGGLSQDMVGVLVSVALDAF
jgi:hypothetical protein